MAITKMRYTVCVDKEMFDQIENFRFNNRFQSRSKATAELIRRGLESLKQEQCSKK